MHWVIALRIPDSHRPPQEKPIMARATQSRSSDKAADAVALLKQDHRTVEALFDEFEDAEDDQLAAIAERVCQLLTVHAQIEEEILYPNAKEAFDDEDDELINEATVEHAGAKDLIAQIEEMSAEDELFKAKVKVLSEYIKHHVKEEENELFPKLRKTDLDLKDLGQQLHSRKLELMEEMGIAEDEDADEDSKPKAKGKAGSRGAARPAHHASARGKSNSRSSRQ
jgi:hemerythrin superfamily protein